MSETICSNGDSTSASEREVGTRWRLIGFSALLALTIGLVAFVEVNTWRQLERLRKDFKEANLESFYLGVYLRETVLRMDGALFRFELSEDAAERESFQRDAEAMTQRIKKTRALLTTSTERELIEEISRAGERYVLESEPLLERGLRGIRKDTAAKLRDELAVKSAPLIALADKLVQAQNVALNRFFDSSGAALGVLQTMLVVSLVLFAALVGSAAALMFRAFVAPLRVKLSQREALLARQEKLASLGVLAAGVAHEIRNPLTAIKFRLFSLKQALPEGFGENEDVEVINNEINRLERIVKDFLQFARPSQPEAKLVPIESILTEVRDLLRTVLDQKSIELKLEADDATLVRADRQQIQQVLINLVQNAAESIGQNGMITLRVRREGASPSAPDQPMVTIDVADTGKGIPPEVEKRIFDPFFSTKEGGTGLGLSIASRIIEKHGGFIHYSTEPNRGTTFSLVLPRVTNDESANSAH
ncbi:MAG: MCP four helix bundle domain-containing protein [Verrucomicrobia bacterium]|nr:MCP four helix bundle domain-containing protein [Verrucomicrobiota bacterium]